MRHAGPWIVAGMHRSGTSLLASTLVAAGVDMGAHLLAGDARNPPGYFEDVELLDLHRRMLVAACPGDAAGHADWGWTEAERLDRSAFAVFRDEARALVAARRATGRPWGFKDPRATLLLDFWLELAPDARFLLPYRPPWEVAASMQRLGAEVFLRRPDFGVRIWELYNRHLLDFRRRHPDRTLLVATGAAVDDSRRFGELLGERLGLAATADALAGRLRPELLHRTPPADPLVAVAAAAYPECRDLLAALDAAADLPGDALWDRAPPRPPQAVAEPRVAVVVPCFEHGDFVVEAVASVARSIPLPHELVVVDDGSEGTRTRAILGNLRAAGFDVRERPHRGLAAARNHGFAVTRAPYVIPLDADNLLLPDFVAAALDVLDGDDAIAAVYGDRVEAGLRSGRVEIGDFDAEVMVSANYVDACAVIRRATWEACGGYDEAMPAQGYEDWDLWLAAIARGSRLRWLPRPAFVYRVRPDSMLAVLDASPRRADVEHYLAAKHRGLQLAALRRTVEALRQARRERDTERAGHHATAAALAAAEAELARRAAALVEARQASETAALESAAEVDRLAAERLLLARQSDSLHDRLSGWRARLRDASTPRSARLRERLVRVRSRVEGRPRTGPATPCVIGATGGSGTRVFVRLAAAAGLYVGEDRNPFEDALPIEHFLDRWLLPLWEGGGWSPPHTAPPGMDDDLAATLDRHLAGRDPAGSPWGWKAPRSLYLLPFLAQRFPDLRFLHVVRDGRDMAFSSNQLQLARYGPRLLSAEEQGGSQAERSIALWSRINGLTADYGVELGGAYLRLRLEDLCARPAAVARRLRRFFELPGDPGAAAREVAAPATFGRWRREDPALVARLEAIAGPTLRRFGYPAA